MNTMMPTSMFTLGERGAAVRVGHGNPRARAGGSCHAPGWVLGSKALGTAHQHDDSSGSHEGVEQTPLQREPAAAGTTVSQGLMERGQPCPHPLLPALPAWSGPCAQPCVPCPHVLARCPVAFGPCEADGDGDHKCWQPWRGETRLELQGGDIAVPSQHHPCASLPGTGRGPCGSSPWPGWSDETTWVCFPPSYLSFPF